MPERECQVCGDPATVVRPATRGVRGREGHEVAYYCDFDAGRFLGWGDGFRPLTEEERRGAD